MLRLAPAALLLTAVLGGCLSLPTVGTGRALGSGGDGLTLTATSARFSDVSIGGPRDEWAYDDDGPPFGDTPVLSARGSTALDDRTDLVFGGTSSLFGYLGARRQLAGTADSPLALGIGAEGGANLVLAALGTGYVYGSVPAVLSVHPSRRLALYVAPRYTAVAVFPLFPSDLNRDEAEAWGFAGVSYGAVVDERITLEVAHPDGGLAPTQVSVAFTVRVE